MIAEIVSVGTELLLGQIIDTHAPTMARILAECGIGCYRRSTVGDNFERVVATLQEALGRSDIVVTIGGLGPTLDDLTRDAIAKALGDQMLHSDEMEEKLRKFFSLRNIQFTPNNARQANRPASAKFIDNPNGTAPGLLCEKNGKIVIAFPGPKGEFEPMARGPVLDYLSRLQGDQVIHSRVLRIIGIGESMLEDKIQDIIERPYPTVAPYAHTGEVHLRLTAKAATIELADLELDPVEAEIRERVGNAVYGRDLTTLEQAVIELLVAAKATVSTAESMTGGELAGRLTSVAGSSAVFAGGVVAYQSAMKSLLAGVDADLLAEKGPVSPEVAAALAEGVKTRLGSTYGVGITGNAGPTSDVDGKPVGLVYMAIAGPNGVHVEEAHYRGLREDIRRRTTQTALHYLRNALLQS